MANSHKIEDIFREYYKVLLSICTGILRNQTDAEDIIGDLFEYLIKNPEVLGNVKNLKNWLVIAAQNRCFNLCKVEKRRRETIQDYFPIKPPITSLDSTFYLKTEKILGEGELLSEVYQAFGMLNENQRRCLVHYYLAKKSYQEIGEIERLDPNEVKNAMYSGKKKMIKLMKEKFRRTLKDYYEVFRPH